MRFELFVERFGGGVHPSVLRGHCGGAELTRSGGHLTVGAAGSLEGSRQIGKTEPPYPAEYRAQTVLHVLRGCSLEDELGELRAGATSCGVPLRSWRTRRTKVWTMRMNQQVRDNTAYLKRRADGDFGTSRIYRDIDYSAPQRRMRASRRCSISARRASSPPGVGGWFRLYLGDADGRRGHIGQNQDLHRLLANDSDATFQIHTGYDTAPTSQTATTVCTAEPPQMRSSQSIRPSRDIFCWVSTAGWRGLPGPIRHEQLRQ